MKKVTGKPLSRAIVGLLMLTPCMALKAEQWRSPEPFSLKTEAFEKEIDGKPVSLYTIRNSGGMVVRITNYGARIQQIIVPDRYGKMGDVAQGYESIDAVLSGQGSMGAFIGRFANRLQSTLVLDGQEYKLAINNSKNLPITSHGGIKGSRFLPFDTKQLSDNSVQMSLLFKDGEEGFPGDMPVRVIYTVTEDNELIMSYDAVAIGKKTVANFTGHTFFNLSGDLGSSTEDHIATVNANKVMEVDENLMPTGKLRDVSGSPMDFRKPKPFAPDINADYDLIKAGKGYDHFYVINQETAGALTLHSKIEDPKSGRVMEVWSTEPGVQIFTGNSLRGQAPRDTGKGAVFQARSGVCVEPSHFPDGPNHPEFASIVLAPGEWYNGKIIYKFSTDQKAR